MENQTYNNLIYNSVEKDSQSRSLVLKTRSCMVEYYTIHKLEPLDILVSALLLDSEKAQLECAALGRTLGFDVEAQPENGMYYDEAEDNLFRKFLRSVQEWGIISVDKENGLVTLTDLGKICLQNKEKYKFFSAQTDALEFVSLKAAGGETISLYPFHSELGLSLSLDSAETLKYEDCLCDAINSKTDDVLVNNLKLQVPNGICVYKAELINYLGVKPIKLDVELYETEGKYTLNFISAGKSCLTLNALFELEVNADAKERKVEQCLYYRLVNNPDVILDYKALQPFEDIIEVDQLIKDSRLVWTDQQLLQLIISQCDADRWHSLSKHCDVEVLKSVIPEHTQDLDWGTLTLRLDSQYISTYSTDYPWDKYTLFARTPVEKELIRKFLVEHSFPEGKDDDQWDWDDVLPIVGMDFITQHLRDIPFDLSEVTKELDDAQRQYIVTNPEARWDWHFVVTEYPIDFIASNVAVLYPHINMQILLQRIFTDSEFASRYVTSQPLKDCIRASELPQRFNANNLGFVWSDEVIVFFEACGLISWSSTTYKKGFECNPNLVWDENFFQKYSDKVTTPQGCTWVSRRITNYAIVDNNPNFQWNEIALSQNPAICHDLTFITSHWEVLDAATIIMCCDTAILEGLFRSLSEKAMVSQLLAKSLNIQKRLVANLSTETILNSYSEGWNKTLFTERICQSIDLATLDDVAWNEMLDWEHLTANLSIADIQSHISKYADKWNHIVFTNRVTGKELLTDKFLETYAEVIAEQNLAEEIWPVITCKFPANELISLVEEYSEKQYEWDYAHMYELADFPAKKYLEQHTENVRWSEFSASAAANRLFSKTGANKTQSLWLRIYEDMLNNANYQWNFDKLTKQPNILKLPKLFMQEKAWDWKYISQHATWISTQKGRNYYFRLFADLLDFGKLSHRTDIELTEKVIEQYDKKKQWDWDALVRNESINFSFDYIDKHEDKPWDWHFLAHREGLPFDIVLSHKEKDWDWYYLSTLDIFVPTVDLLNYLAEHDYEIDWKSVSGNKEITSDAIDTFKDNIDWNVFVNRCPALLSIATVDFLKKYKDAILWEDFNERLGLDVTNEMLQEFADRLNWRFVSKSQKIKFTEELIRKYEEKWFWSELMRNVKVQEDIPDFKNIFADHRSVVTFTDRIRDYRDNPCIYHFTHFYNAIDVIRSRKILSRDRAEELGLLKYDSAGSVVFRSSKAHKFARFYFRPCTPTQHYNEALGADSQLGYYNWRGEWKSKYPKAVGLGLPKCPVPVFFKFDMEEVLAKIPEKCYYSDKNMQSDNPNVYQIIDRPESLGLEYLYSTMQDAYSAAKPDRYSSYNREVHLNEMSKVIRYSQQEFLVMSEFDFNEIKSLKIICYDSSYAELLKQIFADDPISEKIVTHDDESIFERKNRRLYLSSSEDNVYLSTDFEDEYYFNITGERLAEIEFNLSGCEIIFDTRNELRLKGSIAWKKTDISFNISFVDPKARTKEWLVYNNLSDVCEFEEHHYTVALNITHKQNDEFLSMLTGFPPAMLDLKLQLDSSLFYSHMLHSHHGIAHTARVLFATYLITNAIGTMSQAEKDACYYVAIIHDLGKSNDREGQSHGNSSALLYQEQLKEYIQDDVLRQLVFQAIKYHSVEDSLCPADCRSNIVWKVLKDADALDRWRFNGKGCDKSYLRLPIFDTNEGYEILNLMSYLPNWTKDNVWNNPYEEIVESIKNNI